MPSIETQNVAAASAQTGFVAEHPAVRAPNHAATPQQVARASQEIVDRTTVTPREDSQRTTQVPKKTEGTFAGQRTKKEPKAAPDEADREPPNPVEQHRVDIKA